MQGGKVRSCWALAQGAPGLVTAGSRASPQVNIVAHIARKLGIPARCHTPSGALSPEVEAAAAAGAEIVQHRAGYNNVIIARAREDAVARGWVEIPFGMECDEAPRQTRTQTRNLPVSASRLVVPVGSGMSLAGILWGMLDEGRVIPVLGVVVGADPAPRLDRYAPPGWRDMVELVKAPHDYHAPVEARVGGVRLDPHYEAKCVEFMRPGDCLWVVGVRQTDARPDTGGWTYGMEIETGGFRRDPARCPARAYVVSEVAIVNPDGSPGHWDNPIGGEIVTHPTGTPEEQGQIIDEWYGLYPDTAHSYRSSTHGHIRVPGLIEDIAALQRVFAYAQRWGRWFIDTHHVPPERDAAWHAIDPDGAAWRYVTIDRALPPAWRIAQIEKADSPDEFFRAHMLNKRGEFVPLQAKRYAINFLSLPKHGTIEFRHFGPAHAGHEARSICEFLREFMVAALATGEELPDIVARNAHWVFPRWEPLDAALERAYQERKPDFDRSTPKYILLGRKQGAGSAVVRP